MADRLDVIYKLQQKHKVNTVDELIAVHAGLSEKLMNMTSLEDQIVHSKSHRQNSGIH